MVDCETDEMVVETEKIIYLSPTYHICLTTYHLMIKYLSHNLPSYNLVDVHYLFQISKIMRRDMIEGRERDSFEHKEEMVDGETDHDHDMVVDHEMVVEGETSDDEMWEGWDEEGERDI